MRDDTHAPRLLEEVFKTSGPPTHTFVRPREYADLLVALRTPGRGVVIEGPSGIGKTTSVTRALEELGMAGRVEKLSARKQRDAELIAQLPEIENTGLVIIDDFHKLPDSTKLALADFMKLLADEERQESKLVILGINMAGETLIQFAPDLLGRITVLTLEANSPEKVAELVTLGERSLNVNLNVKQEIVENAHGSFYLAQMLAQKVCIDAGILNEQHELTDTHISFETIRGKVFDELARLFMDRTQRFARGRQFRREGRAPYLHLLHWLAQSGEWALHIDHALRGNSELRGSVAQIIENPYLRDLIENDQELKAVLHYEHRARVLTVEDPRYIFFLRNISWASFAKDLGFISIAFPSRYDFALSFAGPDRAVAEALAKDLQLYECEVFYDRFEQHRILAEDVEEYLRPVYQSDASIVIVLLGKEYPKRVWTRIESQQFKGRFADGAVVPVWFDDLPEGVFDSSRTTGGYTIHQGQPLDPQVEDLGAHLIKKIAELRRKNDTI